MPHLKYCECGRKILVTARAKRARKGHIFRKGRHQCRQCFQGDKDRFYQQRLLGIPTT